MTWIREAMLYQLMGVPVWSLLVTVVVFPLLNEIVARAKSTRAQSLLQAVGNGLKATPLYSLPLFKQLADMLATPPVPPLMQPGETGPIRLDRGHR